MHEFRYDYIKNKYGNISRLLFTDSQIYDIKGEDVHEDFSKNKEIFDFSNNTTKSKYFDDSNKSVVGKMKDETTGAAVKEFV